MSIKSDKWIRKMAQEHGMIEPFEPTLVRRGIRVATVEQPAHLGVQGAVDAYATSGLVRDIPVISYGTSSYGYDIRCAREFKVFTNINTTIVDPKNFDERSFVDVESDYCIIPPNSFALARTVEYSVFQKMCWRSVSANQPMHVAA